MANPTPQTRIAELSTLISTHISKIDSWFIEHKVETPSFSANYSPDHNLPPEIEKSRSIVLNATQELNELLQGPRDHIFNHTVRLPLP